MGPEHRAWVPPAWVAWGAVVAAFAFAAVSLLWATGSTLGLDTLGGTVERLGRARDPALLSANAVALVLKVLGGVLALALVQPWGRRLPRRPLLSLGWAGAAVLVVYGVLQVTSVALVAAHVVVPDEVLSARALRWRLLLWEPWFLVWGVLLAGATLRHQRLRPAS
ncbi:DUF3995 domain-containing protein [Cellulomonas sp. zg-ZUI199]|uniref:DUF3995 domain-containing protein n=1 Tax=Cellulomonas wangleii TaxID=2816956 RepID=A0ABX8D5A4_9CELL|nr:MULTISPECIES: DUF3995 domain-containing protein [Cellulomonas]MBO0901930.1 DUF3995 domain-containing protein [Cellulomonas sp. zg-ZUI22]MBO0926110.1 DUF3995 domain-containing protein [Cellulomonas wangleii]QVI62630.1 DUF3995 domain-containing protein [Cellulomonas wangleii]